MPKVLIAYETRYGSTKEIAEQIGIFLKNENVETEVVNLKEVKKRDWPSVDDFDGAIVGSGIMANMWTKKPKEFLKKNKENFEKRYLGVFVGCSTVIFDKEKAENDYLKEPLEKMEIEADMTAAFGPVFDFSDKSKLGLFSKGILKSLAKGMAEDKGIKIDFKGRNDLRDWNAMRDFARKFAKMVKS